jgi:putative chitinase
MVQETKTTIRGTKVMELTQEQLKQLLPKNPYVDYWHKALAQLLPDYEINTPERIAAFVAQCAHESGGFTALKENLNYRWQTLRKIFPKYFPTDELAQRYAAMPNKQAAIANRVYANRMGNGPEDSGDGYRYCGRGLIQLTGKENYTWFAASLEISVEEAAEYLETFEGAAQSACWFWETNNLNRWADSGDILTLTKRINGGTIGLDDRIKHYKHALHVLGADHG